jgi:hypothetical protein
MSSMQNNSQKTPDDGLQNISGNEDRSLYEK